METSNQKNFSIAYDMKKVLIIGAGAMGAAFSFPLVDNNHKVTLTEPYNIKIRNQLLNKKKFHPSLKIVLPKNY